MRLSDKGIEFLKKNQHFVFDLGKFHLYDNLYGKRIKNYNQSKGPICIGFGHKVTDEEKKNFKFLEGILPEIAEEIFDKDIYYYQNILSSYIKINLEQNKFDAIFSFFYDFGEIIFKNKILLESINKKNDFLVVDIMKKWVFHRGEKIIFYENKRKKEIDLYLYGKY